jgi:asparagine synthase (glutamine-hydrolysing)
MCGLAGILRLHPPRNGTPPPHELAIPDHWLSLLEDAIRFRGPDDRGVWRDRARRPDGSTADVALVHRRLSIIDPTCGHQPMVSPAGRQDRAEGPVAVVFNGCIYNHALLRAELAPAGHRFTTHHSDTEVLLHGWRQWGPELPARLDGMFAVALWDADHARLVLMRDRTGEKPLYWAELLDGQVIVFASTAAAILTAARTIDPGFRIQIDPAALATWLTLGYDGAPPVRGLSALAPGHIAQLSSATSGPRLVSSRASTPRPDRDPRATLTPDDVDAALQRAVASRLIADVPIAGFLSGGVDSSLIAHYASKTTPHFRTFTVRMNDSAIDESPYASAVAELLGCDHTTVDCDPDAASDLETLIPQIGLPFGDNSLLSTYWVAQAARREGVKVALAGEGGDELFFGYDRYRVARLLHRYRALLAAIPPQIRGNGSLRSWASRLERFASAARNGGYIELMRVFPTPLYAGLGLRLHAQPTPDPLAGGTTDNIPDAPHWDFDRYLPDDLLRKVDSATMAVALEARSPFLASEVLDLTLRCPHWVLMPGGRRKGLLRDVARKHLPASIVDRRKQGFAVPMALWFRNDFGGMRTMLEDHLHSQEPFGPPSLGIDVDRGFVRTLANDHADGLRDHSLRLYAMLVLSVWSRWLAGVDRVASDRAPASQAPPATLAS